MTTPSSELYAVRGTPFSEVIILADDNDQPLNVTGASALFVLRAYPNGPIELEIENGEGISFGTSQINIDLTETQVNALGGTKLHFDLFLQLQGGVKKKILRGDFVLE